MYTHNRIPEMDFQENVWETCKATNGNTTCGAIADCNGHHVCAYGGNTIAMHDILATSFADMLGAAGYATTTQCSSLRKLTAPGESRKTATLPLGRPICTPLSDTVATEAQKKPNRELTPDVSIIGFPSEHFDVVCPDVNAPARVMKQNVTETVIFEAAQYKLRLYEKASAPVVPLVFTMYGINDATQVWIGKAAKRAQEHNRMSAKDFKFHWTRCLAFSYMRAAAHVARLTAHAFRYGTRKFKPPIPQPVHRYERVIQMDHARRFARNSY
jgi:hypothetical protein